MTYQERHRKGIGGGEIAQVAGLSPWGGQFSVYVRKMGLVEDIEINEHIQRGTFVGPAICQWFAANHPDLHVSHIGSREKTFTPEDYPLVIATPDGLVAERKGKKPFAVLEVKCPQSDEHWGEDGTDQVPDYVLPQLHWEMAAAGVKKAIVCCFAWGRLKVFYVDWNQRLFDYLYRKAEEFWQNHILAENPPPPDGSTECEEWIREKYPRATMPALGEIDNDTELEMINLASIKGKIKELEQGKSEIEQKIKLRIGDLEGIRGDVGKATWSQRAGSLSWKSVAEELAERLTEKSELDAIIEKHRSEPSRFLRVTVKKGFLR